MNHFGVSSLLFCLTSQVIPKPLIVLQGTCFMAIKTSNHHGHIICLLSVVWCEFPVAFLLKQMRWLIKEPQSWLRSINFSAVFLSLWYDLAYVHQLSLAPANSCALSLSENKPLIFPAFHSSLCLWTDCLQEPIFGPSSSHCHFLILNSHFS